MRYCPQQTSIATWPKISSSVASSSCKYHQPSWMLKCLPHQKMKHLINLNSFFAYHKGPWVQALYALDSFCVHSLSFPELTLFSSSYSIYYNFLVLSWITAIKFIKFYTNSNPSWCTVLMLHLLICDFWWASSTFIMSC